MKETSVNALKLLLKLLYCDTFHEKYVDYKTLIDVLKLSNRFDLKTLSEIIEKPLISSLDVMNVVEVFKFSSDLGSKVLSK